MRNPNTVCLECGTSIYRRPYEISKGPVFCSRKCAVIRIKKPDVHCGICGTIVKNERRAKYCSKLCSNEAIRRFPRKPRSDKRRNWRQLLIVERGSKCNRCPTDFVPVLHVHHIIERCNGGTDDHSNLEILCPTCHSIHHYNERLKLRKVGRAV